jgi:hypothetical protein
MPKKVKQKAGRAGTSSWTQLVPDVERLNSMVLRNYLEARGSLALVEYGTSTLNFSCFKGLPRAYILNEDGSSWYCVAGPSSYQTSRATHLHGFAE